MSIKRARKLTPFKTVEMQEVAEDYFADYLSQKSDYGNLKRYRKIRGFTLESLSELTGISPSYLSRLEAGARRLNSDLLERLSIVLGCEPSDLLPPRYAKSDHQADIKPSMDSQTAEAFPQKDLPVFALQESDTKEKFGYLSDFTGPIAWTFRIPQLLGSRSSFALYVPDDNLLPQYEKEDLLYIHTSRPISVGAKVAVIHKDDHVRFRRLVGFDQQQVRFCEFDNDTEEVVQRFFS